MPPAERVAPKITTSPILSSYLAGDSEYRRQAINGIALPEADNAARAASLYEIISGIINGNRRLPVRGFGDLCNLCAQSTDLPLADGA